MPTDVIPMLVADMDFESPPDVRDAILKQIERGCVWSVEDLRKVADFCKKHQILLHRSQ